MTLLMSENFLRHTEKVDGQSVRQLKIFISRLGSAQLCINLGLKVVFTGLYRMQVLQRYDGHIASYRSTYILIGATTLHQRKSFARYVIRN